MIENIVFGERTLEFRSLMSELDALVTPENGTAESTRSFIRVE